jgi:acetylornithine/succinyldiaminopimelate/putrescine aminotransferase
MEYIERLLQDNRTRGLELQAQHINPSFAKVLTTIGFDRPYSKGVGAHLWDTEGNRYLDMLSGYGVFVHGRNHPVIRANLKAAMDLDLPNLVKMDAPVLSGLLAKELCKRAAHAECDSVFFANSGAEAVEAAMKFARAATGRDSFLYLDHGYHGLTLGTLSLNGCAHFRQGFGELPPAKQLDLGDLNALETELKTKRYAGFVFEPVQGKGVFFPANDYYQRAQDLCRKYGTLFIADEVQSGMGRTGRFFAHEHWGLKPDIITLSKGLSGGYVPVSAVITRRDIHKKTFSSMDRSVVHSSTFSQNDMAMAAGLVALKVLDDEKLAENAERMGNLIMERLRPLTATYEMLSDVRGKGLMIGFEFSKPKSLKLAMAWNMVHAADKSLFSQMVVIPLYGQHRILTQVAGHNMDIVKIIPSLVMGEADVDWFVKAFTQVLDELHNAPSKMLEITTRLAKAALMPGASAPTT